MKRILTGEVKHDNEPSGSTVENIGNGLVPL